MSKDITKQEADKILKLNKNLATLIQDFLIKEFNLIKVDSEYLELKISGRLLEVGVFGSIDSVMVTVGVFKGIKEIEVNRDQSIEEAYIKIKSLIKGASF